MTKFNPDKKFIPVPPKDSTCACSECNFMKLITIKKIYESLRDEMFEINLDKELMEKAAKPLLRMMEISEKLNI